MKVTDYLTLIYSVYMYFFKLVFVCIRTNMMELGKGVAWLMPIITQCHLAYMVASREKASGFYEVQVYQKDVNWL